MQGSLERDRPAHACGWHQQHRPILDTCLTTLPPPHPTSTDCLYVPGLLERAIELARAAGASVAVELASFEVVRAFREVRGRVGRSAGVWGAAAQPMEVQKADGLFPAPSVPSVPCRTIAFPPCHTASSPAPCPPPLPQSIKSLLESGAVDVAFCNEDEAMELAGGSPEQGLDCEWRQAAAWGVGDGWGACSPACSRWLPLPSRCPAAALASLPRPSSAALPLPEQTWRRTAGAWRW